MTGLIDRRAILNSVGVAAGAAAGATAVPAIAAAAECQDVTENLNLIRARYEAVNDHDWPRFQTFYDDAVGWNDPGLAAPISGPTAVRQRLEVWAKAFPDLHWNLDEIFASGDQVCALFTFTGTHSGELPHPNGGILLASHRRVRVPGAGRYRIRKGKIYRSDIYFDFGHFERPHYAENR